MDLERGNNENYVSYLKRIIQLKRDNKIDYTELGDYLLGTDNVYSSENIRKAYYILNKIVDKIDDDTNFTEDDILREYEQKKQELQKERYKLQITKLEYNRLLKKKSAQELFSENLEFTRERLVPPTINRVRRQENDKCYVVGISDIHYGATFNSVNNTYSREECKRRFDVLFSELEKFIISNDIYNLKILNTADTIQGMLRLTDLQINDIPVVECVVEISRLLATFLNDLSALCNIEYYHVPCANHTQTRPLNSKASELATEDLEKIIVSYIHDLLKDNKGVKVIYDINKDHIDFNIFDFNCIALHGHQIKRYETALKDLSNLYMSPYQYVFLGHKHSAREVIVGEKDNANLEVITLPSFIGSDPYSDSLFCGAKAMVKIYKFDRVYGHVGNEIIILN